LVDLAPFVLIKVIRKSPEHCTPPRRERGLTEQIV
jgi:hypothetical protein